MNNVSFLRYTIIAITLLLAIPKLHAQESSAQALVDAQEVFTRGKIELVPQLLEPCLKHGNRGERTSAYRLLTLCHLYYNDINKATKSMTMMLRTSPEYKIQDIDPSEFVHLYNTFRSNPFVILGVKTGLSYGNVYQHKNFNDVNSLGYIGSYSVVSSFGVGASAEFMLHDNYSIVMECFYSNTSYNLKRELLDYANLTVSETNNSVRLPVLLQWNILKKSDIVPYINLGATLDFLLSAKSEVSRVDNIENYPKREIVLGSAVDVTNNRNFFNTAITAGAGVRIKNVIGNGYLSFDVRYNRYLAYNIDNNKRVGADFLVYNYMHTDNPLKFQNYKFLIGYKLPIYRPRQRNKHMIKQVNPQAISIQ